MNSASIMDKSEEVILSPMYRLPIIIIIFGITLFLAPIPSWIGIATFTFGLFLLVQSFTLRVKVTSEAFIVLQLNKEIRCFPFKDWLAWRIFLPNLPGILYFRETASPHLLPILFDIKMLESQLEEKVSSLKIKNESK